MEKMKEKKLKRYRRKDEKKGWVKWRVKRRNIDEMKREENTQTL